MTSPQQTAANQRNAQHSTGPRSAEGKARAAANSTRHGFRSQTVLLPTDDPQEYAALLDLLTAEHQPQELIEERYVREMADAEWRLRRCRHLLQALLDHAIQQVDHPDPDLRQALAFQAAQTNPLFAHEARFLRQFEAAQRGLDQYRRACAQTQHDRFAQQVNLALHAPIPGRASTSNEPILTPRNAPCPCQSGQKYKRCCGKSAPPVLQPNSRAA